MRNITIEEGAYFAHRDPDCPLSMNDQEARRRDFHQWFGLAIRDEDAAEVDAVTHESVVARKLGVSIHIAGRYLDAMRMFHHMPVTLGRQLMEYPLDLPRILGLTRALIGLSNEELASIDEDVAFLITPTKKGQVLPLGKKLGSMVDDIVISRFGNVQREPEEDRFLTMRDEGEGNTHLEAVISGATADVLQQCLEQKAAQLQEEADLAAAALSDAFGTETEPRKISPFSAEVFEELIKDKASNYSVTLNFFTSPDLDGVYMPSVGFLSATEAEKWKAIASAARDLSNAEMEVVNHYTFSERMQVYMKFRDGHCRMPGCNRKVCDHDHQVNYADGGKTSPSNGAMLCRSCHNLKSAGLVDYTVAGGVITWKTPDGKAVTSYPTGADRLFARTYRLRRDRQIQRRKGNLEVVPELPPPF